MQVKDALQHTATSIHKASVEKSSAIDTKTGNMLWKFNNTDSGVDTSWGLMPIFIAAIADGKVYAFNNEHSPNCPLYKGYSIYCINATTGEEIYKMLVWSGQTGGQGGSTQLS